MQLLISRSKYFLSVVLSCSLLIAWFGTNDKLLHVYSSYSIEPSASLSAQLDNTGSLSISSLVFPNLVSVSAGNFNSGRPVIPGTDDTMPADVDKSIWDSLSRNLKLDYKAQSAQVRKEIRKILADQTKFYEILQSARPYIYFIYSQTQQRGLPAELALIPVIESEYNPNDHSTKGATGLWQLMSETARELGIKANSGRRNVVASTNAALAYFNDLGTEFKGNWYLAIAAYNCGQVKIEHAIRRTGSRSFWDLPLPKETRVYVPKLLAVAAIIKNPKKYGIELPRILNTPYFTTLKLKKVVSLSKVSKSSNISMDTLNRLNPDYSRGAAPHKGVYTLLVPVEKANVVRAQLSRVLAA